MKSVKKKEFSTEPRSYKILLHNDDDEDKEKE
jgi:hypothetical protein